ncbi:MAG: hypothetical protein R2834_12985 [Rhodothermales bacterium]
MPSNRFMSASTHIAPHALRVSRFLLFATLLQLPACGPDRSVDGETPIAVDERLVLTLVASDPDLVTPIGLAIDGEDRLYVLESHTHTQPADYAGPTSDRIKRFVEGDEAEPALFADGFQDGMNLGFSPDGDLFVVTSKAVIRLYDRDRDGKSEARDTVLALVEPESVYDHAALLGIAFSHDGWMYVSRGNVGGQPWTLRGSDGRTLSGYGDGGDIVRSRPDGAGLSEVATGFWNPFDLTFDTFGRLLAIDNDPDSRGPNRLVHVVAGGDYGYQSLYGGSGIHPYLAWNGELPGTLPFIASLGEAPSGLLNADLAALPADYAGNALATIWEESRIVRIRMTPRGMSLQGESETILQGGPDFRPVALATDSKGRIYVTDWVMRQYPNHGRGRLWRIDTKPNVERLAPRSPREEPENDTNNGWLDVLRATRNPDDLEALKDALASDDPFQQQAAQSALAQPAFRDALHALTNDSDPRLRVGAIVAMRRAGLSDPGIARRLLTDGDARVRRAALAWVGRAGMTEVLPDVERGLRSEQHPELFETYLATVRHLQPDFLTAYRAKAAPTAKQLKRVLPAGYLAALVGDPALPEATRAIALRYLEHPADHVDVLISLTKTGGPDLALEAVRTLGDVPDAGVARALRDLAGDDSAAEALRAEAMSALARQPGDATVDAMQALVDGPPAVQRESLRLLRGRPLADTVRQVLASVDLLLAEHHPIREALHAQIAMALGAPSDRPDTEAAWQAAVATGGDADSGRRVFFSPLAQCSLCHRYEGRGGVIGPDLTNVGRSKTREQIVNAILRPSDEISPEYQGWYVTTTDGRTHYGRQIDIGESSIELMLPDGTFETYRDVASYGIAEASLMPEDLEANLTVDDLRDLMAFLTR